MLSRLPINFREIISLMFFEMAQLQSRRTGWKTRALAPEGSFLLEIGYSPAVVTYTVGLGSAESRLSRTRHSKYTSAAIAMTDN